MIAQKLVQLFSCDCFYSSPLSNINVTRIRLNNKPKDMNVHVPSTRGRNLNWLLMTLRWEMEWELLNFSNKADLCSYVTVPVLRTPPLDKCYACACKKLTLWPLYVELTYFLSQSWHMQDHSPSNFTPPQFQIEIKF